MDKFSLVWFSRQAAVSTYTEGCRGTGQHPHSFLGRGSRQTPGVRWGRWPHPERGRCCSSAESYWRCDSSWGVSKLFRYVWEGGKCNPFSEECFNNCFFTSQDNIPPTLRASFDSVKSEMHGPPCYQCLWYGVILKPYQKLRFKMIMKCLKKAKIFEWLVLAYLFS